MAIQSHIDLDSNYALIVATYSTKRILNEGSGKVDFLVEATIIAM